MRDDDVCSSFPFHHRASGICPATNTNLLHAKLHCAFFLLKHSPPSKTHNTSSNVFTMTEAKEEIVKEFTQDEVSKHTSNDSCWLTIGNSNNGGPKVYDVTDYLDEHPGGAEVMLDVAGQDADEFFEDIGHSKDARVELKQYLIGNFKMDPAQVERMRLAAEASANSKGAGSTTGFMVILVVIIAMAVGYYQTQMSKVA